MNYKNGEEFLNYYKYKIRYKIGELLWKMY